jgi:hypothetical protein
MFDNLFVEMGPWASVLALLFVVVVPALVVAGAMLETARPVLAARWELGLHRFGACITSLFAKRLR